MLSGDGFPDDGESGNSFVMMMMMRLSMLTIMATVMMIMI